MRRTAFILAFAVILAASTQALGQSIRTGNELAKPLHNWLVIGIDGFDSQRHDLEEVFPDS